MLLQRKTSDDTSPIFFDFDMKMPRPCLTNINNSRRTPSVIAPWPEPPCPKHLKTFEFFPFLASAVRKRIWRFTLPGPRVIEIQYANKQHEFRSPIPVILHVCREARAVALEEYATAAARPLNGLEPVPCHYYLTYVNFRIDTFCPIISLRSFITGEWKTFLRTLPNCEMIERVGLPKRCFQFPSGACIPLLLQYTSLREMAVIADPCADHRPTMGRRNREGWRLGPGELLPTMETFGKGGRVEIMENYSIEFMDKVRQAWRAEHDRDLTFVHKGVCWGGECWDVKGDAEERQVTPKARTAIRKMIDIPRRGVAKVMMHCT